MSQIATPSDKTGKTNSSSLTPPDERFWQRYSPHAEFPLSSAGSFLLHLLFFGLLGLMAVLSTWLFSHANRSLPIEAVRVAGGGGNRLGKGDDPNNGRPVEVGAKPDEKAVENVPSQDETPAKLDVDPAAKVDPKFENKSSRRIQSKNSGVFAKLLDGARPIDSTGSNSSGKGQGGSGQGGGKGSGTGPGAGPGKGDGPAGNLTQREKRSLRWTMLFNTRDSADYVAQLQGLGAILAIPVAENGNDMDYRLVRNLAARPAKLLNEDIGKVLREANVMVKFYDDNPRNTEGILAVLGLPSPKIPREKFHFMAFMPEKLEQKLLRLEIAYLKKHHPGRSEDDIDQTKFRIIIRKGGKYEPEVEKQTLN